tara:strand:+ start:467 stop:919 length:453 start_codon:yes stop_codon:yes gene_type:complete
MEMYQGEILGEALFDRMLAFYEDPNHNHKIATMLQLESETVTRLRPALMELGLDLSEAEKSRTAGIKWADSLRGLSWNEFMVSLRDALQPYIDHYSEITAQAPPRFAAIAESMVLHEKSLKRFAELEIAGDSEHSLDDIIAQLHHPLPKP